MIAALALHWRAALVALVAAALCALGWHLGAAHVSAQWSAEKVATAAAVAKVAAQQGAVTTQVETKVVTRLQVVHDQGKTITKQVIKYVPLSAPDLPYGFRLLHDAAAAGVPLPDTAGKLDGPAVPAATVAATVSDNYAGCRANAEVIRGWQEWADEQAAASK
jgi:hypothetical protein